MDELKILKGKILTEKLNVYNLNIEKIEAVRNQNFYQATQLRDQEKQSYQKLQELKLEVLEKLSAIVIQDDKIELYLDLQELLFEFHPIQFRNDSLKHSNLSDVQLSVAKYWQIRIETYNDFKKFIEAEYVNLSDKWIAQVGSKDSEVTDTLKQLNHIRAFLMRFK
jgi:hypothetical protein